MITFCLHVQKVLSDIDKVRHIIYYPARNKAENTTPPTDRNNIQFISIEEFEKQGSTAYIGTLGAIRCHAKHHAPFLSIRR